MRAAIIVKGYPRLSETFVAQELLELQKHGLDFTIYSLRQPTSQEIHPIHGEITADIEYLPEYLYKDLTRLIKCWWKVRKLNTYREAISFWIKDLARDFSFNRVRRIGQAIVLSAEISSNVELLYAHFLHTPASVARYTSMLLNIPWSCSAHAIDVWTTPEWEIRDKVEHCKWIITCTKTNQKYLNKFTDDPEKIKMAYHGIDLKRFPANKKNYFKSNTVTRLLSVGRVVEKKGFEDLLLALSRLPKNLNWTFEHIGGGKDLNRLKKLAVSYHISEKIIWRGTCSQNEVLSSYTDADIFILASKIARNGDRDGLPNVLIEAQSQGIPCISTRVSAIPELIQDGNNGLLVEPGDVDGLCTNLGRLIESQSERKRIGISGQDLVFQEFSHEHCILPLIELFNLQK